MKYFSKFNISNPILLDVTLWKILAFCSKEERWYNLRYWTFPWNRNSKSAFLICKDRCLGSNCIHPYACVIGYLQFCKLTEVKENWNSNNCLFWAICSKLKAYQFIIWYTLSKIMLAFFIFYFMLLFKCSLNSQALWNGESLGMSFQRLFLISLSFPTTDLPKGTSKAHVTDSPRSKNHHFFPI